MIREIVYLYHELSEAIGKEAMREPIKSNYRLRTIETIEE
jgi:hypothetical protein